MKQGFETVTESSCLQVIEILRAAIGLKRGKSSEDTFYRHAKVEKPAVKELQE